MVQNIHFLFCLSVPICLPLSIASQWEDNRNFKTTVLSFLLCNILRYSDILKSSFNSLYNIIEEDIFKPSRNCTRKLSMSLLLSNGINNLGSTEWGKYHTSAKQLRSNRHLSFESHKTFWASPCISASIEIYTAFKIQLYLDLCNKDNQYLNFYNH